MNEIPAETIRVICRVLELEESPQIDWHSVGSLCDDEIRRINESGLGGTVNGLPYQFLEDHDIRRKDATYAENQRRRMRKLLDVE